MAPRPTALQAPEPPPSSSKAPVKWVSVGLPAQHPLLFFSGNFTLLPRKPLPSLFPHAVQLSPFCLPSSDAGIQPWYFSWNFRKEASFPLGLPGEWDETGVAEAILSPKRETAGKDSTEKHRACGWDCAFQELSGFLDAAELEAVYFRSFYAPAH